MTFVPLASAPAPITAARLDAVASSQPLPPTTLLVVWPSTAAVRRMAANCLAPRSRSSARSTPLLSARQRAQGAPADTRAACTDTPSGAIAPHSASGTASLPTMNMPIRARQPQLSFSSVACLVMGGRVQRRDAEGNAEFGAGGLTTRRCWQCKHPGEKCMAGLK